MAKGKSFGLLVALLGALVDVGWWLADFVDTKALQLRLWWELDLD